MRNILEKLLFKSRENRSISHIYALEVDRLLRNIGKESITFSANGLSESSLAIAHALSLNSFFDASKKIGLSDAIYRAEMMAKEGRRSESIDYAFSNACGPQIDALNIFYANNVAFSSEIRLYFLNKYFGTYGLRIELNQNEGTSFFNRIACVNTSSAVDGPIVTVIMPAHNAEKTIELAVNSLLSQSWHNLQIIIVDDASTDSTLKKSKDLAKRDSRIQVLGNSVSAGVGICYNLGVAHARGEWLTVHHADDLAFPDRIEQQVNALQKANAIACTGGMLRMRAQGLITCPGEIGSISADGYQRICFSSLLMEARVFCKELEAWDLAREVDNVKLLDRIKALGMKSTSLVRPLMLSLDDQNKEVGFSTLDSCEVIGKSIGLRAAYKQGYQTQHQSSGAKKSELYEWGRKLGTSIEIDLDRGAALQISELDVSKPISMLVDINEVVSRGDYVRAIALADAHLPPDLLHTAEVIRANASVMQGNLEAWRQHLNAYLSHFSISPIRLEGSGTLFDRLTGGPLAPVAGGALVTIIMPVWNSERTVRMAIQSILNQTWQNLELLIVDDASSDGTWSILREIATKDVRVRIFRNIVNVGPYVSKNIALCHSRGEFVTGHDSDDWAHPQRIELHTNYMLKEYKTIKASLTKMIRMSPNGFISNIKKISSDRIDGVCQTASISCMFRRDFLINELGYWDCVRFGGDSELIKRAEHILSKGLKRLDQVSMFCLDIETSLSNHPIYGISKTHGIVGPRLQYRRSYLEWHQKHIYASNQFQGAYLDFPPTKYRFDIPQELRIDFEVIEKNISYVQI